MSRFCTECGNELKDGDTFCTKCGKAAEGPVVQAAVRRPESDAWSKYLRLITAGASVLMIIAVFLPFLDIMGMYSWNLVWQEDQIGDGVILIILGVISLIFTALNKKIPVAGCGILSLIVTLNVYVRLNSIINESEFLFRGSGYYLTIIAVLVLTVASVLNLVQSIKAKKAK